MGVGWTMCIVKFDGEVSLECCFALVTCLPSAAGGQFNTGMPWSAAYVSHQGLDNVVSLTAIALAAMPMFCKALLPGMTTHYFPAFCT